MHGAREIDDESSGVRLLFEIWAVFEERDVDRLATADLLDALHRLDEAPWGDWYGKPLSARSLAMLRPYGVHSRTVRFDDDSTAKGFLREQFEAPWSRYIPGSPLQRVTRSQTSLGAGLSRISKGHKNPFVTDWKRPQTRMGSGV